MKKTKYHSRYYVDPTEVINELKKYMLIDGYNLVLDVQSSKSPYFIDERTETKYMDFFTCFASLPLGLNPPQIMDKKFKSYISEIALNKPSNADIYTTAMATFVKTFFKIAVPDIFKYSFYISGGALAVENALKTAFDWKVRKNFEKGYTFEKGSQIIHFKDAFHGRSGYTMSLTNTDPAKTDYFPKFKWPRIINPKITFPLKKNLDQTIELEEQAVNEIKQAFIQNKDDIAAIIIEPIQGEGGDNHFRKEFLLQLRQLADENEALLIYDEIQTGVGITGKWWAYQNYDVPPDILAFGKKMQICGILATERVDEVSENVFHKSSRINSTWGGNLTDMVRATKYIEIIDEEHLVDNAANMGKVLLKKLNKLESDFPDLITNSRGLGLFCSFDMPSREKRTEFLKKCFEEGLIILPCGKKTVRFRPPLNIKKSHIKQGLDIINNVLNKID
jgi:L-lysine 6-transaminase